VSNSARSVVRFRRSSIRDRSVLRALGLSMIAVVALGCAGDETPPSGTPDIPDGAVLATFDTASGSYRALITDEVSVQRVLDGPIGEHIGVPNGRLAEGDGGVNAPHDWHVFDVEVVDMTMELCDGTVDYLNEIGLERFMEEHTDRFCPWTAVLIDVAQ